MLLKIKKYAEKAEDDEVYFTLVNNLGILYKQQGEYVKSIQILEKGIRKYKNREDELEIEKLYNSASNSYSRIGDYKRQWNIVLKPLQSPKQKATNECTI